MQFKFIAQVLLTSVALSGMMAYTIEAQAVPTLGGGSTSAPTSSGGSGSRTVPTGSSSGSSSSKPAATASKGTSFSCIAQKEGSVATVGQRPGGQPVPIIIWTTDSSKYFGEQFTPQTRCNIVTQKLNTAVSNNGGSLKNLLLTNGAINGQTVICALGSSETSCNSNNVLFTLKPDNAQKAGAILGQLLQISRSGSSAGVIRETPGQTYVNLENWEKQALGSGNGDSANPEAAVNPEPPANNENPSGL